MGFHYEELSPEKFQQFCQALLTSSYPHLQCLPVGQPDGGRDAQVRLVKAHGKRESLIFQVKFERTPSNTADEREAVRKFVESEQEKVTKLIGMGAKEYHLLTNVRGTAHPNTGSIDRVNEELTQAFGIPAYCWWRQDIDSRVEASSGLKWSYPEILKASDILQSLLEGRIDPKARDREAAIRGYLATQYKDDEELRFRQVELQNKLFSLFVDIPFGPMGLLDNRLVKHVTEDGTIISEVQGAFVSGRRNTHLAAERLSNQEFRRKFPQIVLEGAPGQGKSTVTQFICQVHRHKLLNKTPGDLEAFKTRLSADLRLPFRVDLRDLATWLAGKNPFSADPNDRRYAKSKLSFEAFLAAQVSELSGGHDFTVGDLTASFAVSNVLIVLDGLDEVADIPLRQKIIEEIDKSLERLRANASNVQTIVTSRPAAFANSPGFSKENWTHFQLLPLADAQVEEYSLKWMNARELSKKQKAEFTKVLQLKLKEPHMKLLSQNAMQLAILLSLVHTRGQSLPDKRTALYDSYMDLFFSREAEKNEIVLKYRDLLIDIHRFVAWKVQLQAELGGGGAIPSAELKGLIHDYLINQGHQESLVEQLFTGMVERVVALVQRVEGTFEFEVQPLREYFCARHLYETAPYSPTGAEKNATKPQRFVALAQHPYWLNVTRFYAGCYSSGELASLLVSLMELNEKGENSLAFRYRSLGLMLLSDYVFAQQPRTVRAVVDFVTGGQGIRLIAANMSSSGPNSTSSLPEKSGRAELREAALKHFWMTDDPIEQRYLSRIIADNFPLDEYPYWISIEPADKKLTAKWWYLASYLGVLAKLDEGTLESLIEEHGNIAIYSILQAGWGKLIASKRERYLSVANSLFSKSIPAWNMRNHDSDAYSAIDWLSQFSMVGIYHRMRRSGVGVRLVFPDHLTPHERESLGEAFDAFNKIVGSEFPELSNDLTTWQELTEPIRALFGTSRRLMSLSLFAAGVRSKSESGQIGDGLDDHSVPLVQRARFARLKSGAPKWWRAQLSKYTANPFRSFALLLCLVWASEKTLVSLSRHLEEKLDDLPEEEFRDLIEDLTDLGLLEFGIKGESIAISDSVRFMICCLCRVSDLKARDILRVLIATDKPIPRCGWRVVARLTERLFAANLIDYAEMVRIMKVAYANGESTPMRVSSHPNRARKFPLDIARQICHEPRQHSIYLLNLAESAIGYSITNKTTKVGKVARKNSWF